MADKTHPQLLPDFALREFVTIRDLGLRLNDEEARDIAQQILPSESSKAQIDATVATISGWVAGLVLLARGAPTVTVDLHRTIESQGVFVYFAGEIWHEFSSTTRHTLETVSILPFVTKDLATRLIGLLRG